MKCCIPLLAGLLSISMSPFVIAADRQPDENARNPVDYMIVVTGGELLEGVYPDAHTHFLTRTLKPLGFRCVGSLSVDDNREEMLHALRFASSRASVVIVTGGLGPTPNDITRETVSEFTGIPLHEDSEAIAALEKRFGQSRDQLRPNLRRQTQIPEQGRFLNNALGTAVGLVFDRAPNLIVALPGPPRELQPMVKTELLPFFKERFGTRAPGASMTLRFVGVGQSLIDQTIKDHVAIASDLTITSLFQGSRVDFTFTLPDNRAEDHEQLNLLRKSITEHLRDAIYTDKNASLEEVVLDALKLRGQSLGIVEMGSGGRLAAAFSIAPGASDFLAGVIAASTPSRIRLLLPSSATEPGEEANSLKNLALAASRSMRCDLALIVGPLEANTQGPASVQVGFLSSALEWKSSRITLQGTPEVADPDAITRILDWVRRQAIQ